MKKAIGEYYLGLDIGTNSVGFAVTDLEYNVPRVNNTRLWGVQTFDSAETAAARRMHRTSRRRLSRRNWRIDVLNSFFSKEIESKDPYFFLRLKESWKNSEDKKYGKFSLFNDLNYTDKQYHKEYPTIFHLINHLADPIAGRSLHDVRLLYLAIHHLMMHRGHFLSSIEADNIDSIMDFNGIYEVFRQYLSDEFNIDWNVTDTSEIQNILKDKDIRIKGKQKKLEKVLIKDKFKENSLKEWEIIKLLSGGKVNTKNFLNSKEIENKSFSLKEDFETIENDIEPILLDQFELIRNAKAIYDWAILAELMNNRSSISEAKVKIYEKHKADLATLKYFMKKYDDKKSYKKMFSSGFGQINNYPAYINESRYIEKKKGKNLKYTQKDFCKYVSEVVSGYKKVIEDSDRADYENLIKELENATFMPKQKTNDNAVIPHQLYKSELQKILSNAQTYWPFLKDKDSTGVSVSEKILKLFSFRIPYYMGPLARENSKSEFAWSIRKKGKENEKVYPWNFEKVMDLSKSREKFITKMTTTCTYLLGEDVLPKSSILYSEYMILNELNPLKVNGEPILVDVKKQIIEYFFVENNVTRLTKKRIKDFLVTENYIEKGDEISGIDDDVKANFKSYHSFKKYINQHKLTEEEADDIIYHFTLFKEEKIILKDWMKSHFPKLDKDDIKEIIKNKYKDWGRISRALLKDIVAPDQETGEIKNIIDTLRDTNLNLMQIIADSNSLYKKAIEARNEEYMYGKSYTLNEILEDMYISNSVKRPIYRTLDIISEINGIMKSEPKKIFVEMTREEGIKGDKGRTQSRKSQLQLLYRDCKESTDLINNLEGETDDRLRSEKLYLYYTQFGKCMYTGETINIEELSDHNKWDVDHIYPRSKIKDDSIQNKALVKSEINKKKGDTYPLKDVDSKIPEKMHSFWTMLRDKKLIEEEKYKRLVRSTKLTNEELASFINRQLVETSQSTKAVAKILKKNFPDTKIVYVKSGLVSEFRQTFGSILAYAKEERREHNIPYYADEYALGKSRLINDFHHAKDAYLNIVVGNVYNTKFTENPITFVKNAENMNYSIKAESLLKHDVERNGTVAWISKGDKASAINVEKMMNCNVVNVTRYTTIKKGGLSDQNLMRKGLGQLQIKEGNDRSIAKYGGYNKLAASYFLLVKHDDKKIKNISVIPIDLVYANKIERGVITVEEYLTNINKLQNPQVLLNGRKIKINTLFEFDGARAYLRGKTGSRLLLSSAIQIKLDKKWERYIKSLEGYVKGVNNENLSDTKVDKYFGINKSNNSELYEIFKLKMLNEKWNIFLKTTVDEVIIKGIDSFEKLSIYQQCKILTEVIKTLQAGRSGGCDFRLIGGKENNFLILLNCKLLTNTFKVNCIRIIDQSPTGVFEKFSPNLLEL